MDDPIITEIISKIQALMIDIESCNVGVNYAPTLRTVERHLCAFLNHDICSPEEVIATVTSDCFLLIALANQQRNPSNKHIVLQLVYDLHKIAPLAMREMIDQIPQERALNFTYGR